LLITAGNVHDLVGVRGLLAMGHRPRAVLADRAYDANSLRQELAQRRIKAVIPPNPTRKHPHRYNKTAYKGRNVIERMFCRLRISAASQPAMTSVATSISQRSSWQQL
jgi:IS5 family transposase